MTVARPVIIGIKHYIIWCIYILYETYRNLFVEQVFLYFFLSFLFNIFPNVKINIMNIVKIVLSEKSVY